jgi:hypothetical protein
MEVLNPLMANTLGPSLINNGSINTIQDARLRTPQIPNPGLTLKQDAPPLEEVYTNPVTKEILDGFGQSDFAKNVNQMQQDSRTIEINGLPITGNGSFIGNLVSYMKSVGKEDMISDNSLKQFEPLAQVSGQEGYSLLPTRPTAPIDPRGPTINDPTAPPFLGRPSLENLPDFKGLPGVPFPSQLPPVGINNLLGKVEGGIGAMNPYDNQFNFNDRSSLNTFIDNVINDRLKEFFGGIMGMLDV